MSLLLIVILLLIFLGGPAYYGPRAGWTGPQYMGPVGLLILILLILFLTGVLGPVHTTRVGL